MNDLRKAPLFSSLDNVIDDAIAFLQSDSLLLVTTADLTSVLALGFLESALLDGDISYSRRILPPNSHIPPDEADLIPAQSGVNVLFIDPWNRVETTREHAFIIAPKPVEVEFRSSTTPRRGTGRYCPAMCSHRFCSRYEWFSDQTLSSICRVWAMVDGKS